METQLLGFSRSSENLHCWSISQIQILLQYSLFDHLNFKIPRLSRSIWVSPGLVVLFSLLLLQSGDWILL